MVVVLLVESMGRVAAALSLFYQIIYVVTSKNI